MVKITLERFENAIEKLRELRSIEAEINKGLKRLYPEMNYFSLGKLEADYVDLLKLLTDDNDEWISYYIYECDMGEKPMEVTTPKLGTFKLKTVKQLYALLEE